MVSSQFSTVLRAAIGGISLAMLLAGFELWRHEAAARIQTSSTFRIVSTSISDTEARGPRLVPNNPEDPLFDLYGNEVEDAVADYRIDLRGGVYERHSPETAVSKLGPPGT